MPESLGPETLGWETAMSSRLQAVRAAAKRFAFHRDQHHGWRRAAGWLLACNVLTACAFAGYVWMHSTVYIAVAATPDGRLVRLTPLDEPIMSDAALRNWTVSAVTEAFTLGHHDWRLRLSGIREYFTDSGYESFLKGLDESLFLDRLRGNLQVASAVAQGAPVIVDTRFFAGRVGWAVEFPLLVTFSAGTRRVSQELVAQVLVMRVPLDERPAGIAIEQLIAGKGASAQRPLGPETLGPRSGDMRMQTLSSLPLAALLATLAASPAAAQDKAPGGPGVPLERTVDAWSAHALTDDDAARQGRAALPFTQEQIEILGRILRETQEATARGAGEAPQGRIRRVRLDGAQGGGISGTSVPEIALRRGYVTVLSFTDSTGAPWPIEEALVDRRFLPPGADSDTGGKVSGGSPMASHLLYLAPAAAYQRGNAVVKLVSLAEPVVASLRGTGADADFRVEIRLGVPGPNADPGVLAAPRGFHAGDPVLLALLGGAVPADAERLAIEGGTAGDRAWRRGGDLLLLTRAHLLSPGPLAAERGPGGRWAYRLADTPLVLVSDGGREKRLALSDSGTDADWQDTLRVGDRQ